MDNYNSRGKSFIDRYYDLICLNNNILAWGLGNKEIKGNLTDIPCLKFFVANKVYEDRLNSDSVIPRILNGVLTDIVEVTKPDNNNFNSKFNNNGKRLFKNSLIRPVKGGVLIRNNQQEYIGGTLGSIVYDKNGKKCILSTARVLTGDFKGSIGDSIYQVSEIPKGDLSKYEEEELGKFSKQAENIQFYDSKPSGGASKINIVRNEFDVAIARINEENLSKVDSGIVNISDITGTIDKVNPKETVIISSRNKSSIIKGNVETASAGGGKIVYDEKRSAYFANQIMVKMNNLTEVDYGSVGCVVREGKRGDEYKLFGICIGHVQIAKGKSNYVFFTPIDSVKEAMGIRFQEDNK